jgi:dihydroneopterin aldolase
MQTTIFVEGLLIEASIGVHPHEHESRQPVIMDIWVDLNGIAPEDDRLHETFDYAEVASHAERLAMEAHVQLVETLLPQSDTTSIDDCARLNRPVGLAMTGGISALRSTNTHST